MSATTPTTTRLASTCAAIHLAALFYLWEVRHGGSVMGPLHDTRESHES